MTNYVTHDFTYLFLVSPLLECKCYEGRDFLSVWLTALFPALKKGAFWGGVGTQSVCLLDVSLIN